MSWMRRMVAVLIFIGIACGAQVQQGTGPAFARAEHLRRGVNLSGFYAQTRDFSPTRLNGYMSPADMLALKSLGFDHVRLSIDPQPLIANTQTGVLRAEPMAQLDKTVAQLLDSGLNVILDIHAEEDWKKPLAQGEDGVARLCGFWAEFARHYAKSDPERVYFEILNEPSMDDLYRWATTTSSTPSTTTTRCGLLIRERRGERRPGQCCMGFLIPQRRRIFRPCWGRSRTSA